MTVTRHPARARPDVGAAPPTRRDLLLGGGATAGAAAVADAVLPAAAAAVAMAGTGTRAADIGEADLLTLIGCYDEAARRAVAAQNMADRLYFAASGPADQ